MRATLRRSPASGEAVAEAVRGLRAIDASGEADPIVLAYYPVSPLNPYQSLLYRRAWEHGIVAIPLPDVEHLDALAALARLGATVVLHLHWTNFVLHGAADEQDARRRLAAFLAGLDRFRAVGGRLAWSVHNVVPHEARFAPIEAELQQAIVDRCDAVHVLARDTVAIAAPTFSIAPELVIHAPHPNYIGAYPDTVSRAQARHELAIAPDEIAYAFVGSIRPYKGLDALVAAFDALPDEPAPRRLIVAGRPIAHAEVDRFLDRCVADRRITLLEGALDATEVQVPLRAADLAVLPYERSLNSGALLLALSFGLPVIAPAAGAAREIVEPEFGRTFEPSDDDALAAAMLDADALRTPNASAAARRAAEAYDPDSLSAAFARGLRERLASAARSPGSMERPDGGGVTARRSGRKPR